MPKAVLATVLAVVVAALITVGSAVAATGGTGHTVTQTDNIHGGQTSTDTNPCTGNLIDLTQTSNSVQHITYFPGGEEMWGTFTEEDKVTGVDQGTWNANDVLTVSFDRPSLTCG